jgi:hypothetical protein
MSTTELVSAACPKIGALGSAFYFVEPTVGRGKELGLDGFRFYFLGRGGVLGDVEAEVVASAFGYFSPPFVHRMWDKGRQVIEPRVAAREYAECCAAFGRDRFSDLPGLEAFCAAAEAVDAAANPAGLALYAGTSAEPRAQDPPGRAAQLLAVLREFRGSAHLVAVLAQLLEPRIAHYIRRPDFFASFGYADEQVPEVTEEHRRKLAAADELTDRLVEPAFGVLDAGQATALLDTLGAMEEALAG